MQKVKSLVGRPNQMQKPDDSSKSDRSRNFYPDVDRRKKSL